MSEKPFSVRLTDEEKEMLERIASSKGLSMADVVRMWITKGDVVNILAEQLADLSKDFTRWHLSSHSSSIAWLGRNLLSNAPLEEHNIVGEMFNSENERLEKEIVQLNNKLTVFVKSEKMKRKGALANFIRSFISIVQAYQNNLVRGFYRMAEILPKENRDRVADSYSSEFRVRYNEFAAKYEDFLRRASRELGENFERTLGRAKEFPKKREPWRKTGQSSGV